MDLILISHKNNSRGSDISLDLNPTGKGVALSHTSKYIMSFGGCSKTKPIACAGSPKVKCRTTEQTDYLVFSFKRRGYTAYHHIHAVCDGVCRERDPFNSSPLLAIDSTQHRGLLAGIGLVWARAIQVLVARGPSGWFFARRDKKDKGRGRQPTEQNLRCHRSDFA